MELKEKKFLVKSFDYFDSKNVNVLGIFNVIEDAKKFAVEFENSLSDKLYKKEFCNFCENDGIHKGWLFTLF